MTLPPRIYVLPDSTLPGVGTWTATNDGSMAMEGAVEYVPASEVERMWDALDDLWSWCKNWDAEFMDDPEFDRSKYIAALKGEAP